MPGQRLPLHSKLDMDSQRERVHFNQKIDFRFCGVLRRLLQRVHRVVQNSAEELLFAGSGMDTVTPPERCLMFAGQWQAAKLSATGRLELNCRPFVTDDGIRCMHTCHRFTFR